jgi:hypothetical protein
MAKGKKDVRERREGVLAFLSAEYSDALLYTSELRRAIASFPGQIPADSPYRYLQHSVGDAIVSFLRSHGKPQTIPELVKELKAGHCLFGAIKSAEEITRKAVNAYVKVKRLGWTDRKQTKVGLPEWVEK